MNREAALDLMKAEVPEAMQEANAFLEAVIEAGIIKSEEEWFDDIGPDGCGEVCLTRKDATGYIDIGLRGEGELSWHVRNDRDSSLTDFADDKWAPGQPLPERLCRALTRFRYLSISNNLTTYEETTA